MLTTTAYDSPTDAVIECARHLLDHALPPTLRDDRFSESWAAEVQTADATFVASSATLDGHPFGIVTGTASRGRLQLDALISPHRRDASGDTDAPRVDQTAVLLRLLDDLVPTISTLDIDTIELWGKPSQEFHEAAAATLGFSLHRSLHQMRCPLPNDATALATRSFIPGKDDETLRLVNNRAFAGHPDQGNLSATDLQARLDEPWFDPDGVRLYEVDGAVLGFCWTKVHDEQGLGEIYAIGIDPSAHGQGLGVPMTAAGLHWLAEAGLDTGMLYVEGDNEPALRTYRKLGFDIVRTDRVWQRSGVWPRAEEMTR